MAQSQQIEKYRARATKTVAEVVDDNTSLFEMMGVNPEAFRTVALNAFVTTPDIVTCKPDTLQKALLRCVQAGLMPDAREAVIVPFANDATLIEMVDGMLKIARQATPGLTRQNLVVYDDDYWEYEEGLDPRLVHRPSAAADRSDERIIAAYAICRAPNWAGAEWEWMWRSDIDRVKNRAPSGNKGGSPWGKDYPSMCRKVVLKKLLTRLPRTPTAPEPPPPMFDDMTITGWPPMIDAPDDDGAPESAGEIVEGEVVEAEPAKKAPAKKRAAKKKAPAKKAAAPKADPDPKPEDEPAAEPDPPADTAPEQDPAFEPLDDSPF